MCVGLLSERVWPLASEIVELFGADTRVQCEEMFYASELPPKLKQPEPLIADCYEWYYERRSIAEIKTVLSEA
jgi:hypothetical protein